MKETTATATETTGTRRVTRGRGLLEPLLAQLRARQANRLIPDSLRHGRILDIGCGSFPYFLSHTWFKEKFAIDQVAPNPGVPSVAWHTLNLNITPQLPFDDGFFSAITMLAIVEHLDPNSLVALFEETRRVLQPQGRLIVTTPPPWSDGLLHLMARTGLVSSEELQEHVYAYTKPLLGWYFGRAGFPMTKIRFGYFEFGLNIWATAER